jgi:hypothetical protein
MLRGSFGSKGVAEIFSSARRFSPGFDVASGLGSS